MNEEIIGKHLRVVQSSNRDCLNLEGLVVDETMYLISIQTQTGLKRLIKRAHTFEISSGPKRFLMDGRSLEKRSEERVR